MIRSFFATQFVWFFCISIKQITYTTVLSLSILVCCSCSSSTAILRGQVTEVTGNQMPSPELPQGTMPQPFATRLALCKPLQANFSLENPQLFSKLPEIPVYSFRTKPNGKFSTRVKPGTYTLLIETSAGWWAPYIKGKILYPITLRTGQDTSLRLQVTVHAVF